MIILFNIAIFIFVAGLFNGVMDGIQFINYWLNKYAWFNPELSALNKWKTWSNRIAPPYPTSLIVAKTINDINYYVVVEMKLYWHYLWLYKPKYVEAFPYSSTIFVWVTQGWHLAKMLTFSVYEIIITYFILEKYKPCFEGHSILLVVAYPLTFLALKLIRFLGFSTTYR